MLAIKKMVSDAAQLTTATIVAHYTVAIKPRCVVEAGVQADYLAVAPGISY